MSDINTTTATSPIATASTSTTKAVPTVGQGLDKDAFLKLLVTQLKYQDPTKPMEDTQFISQMAQFSSLEQMTNVSTGMGNLAQMQTTNQALSLVGHTVQLKNASGGDPLSGKVDEVRFGTGAPMIVVGGKQYGLGDVVSAQ